MLSERSSATIQKMPGGLQKPVRLIVFTTDTGCESCPDMLALGRALKARFSKLALETYDAVMDRDKAQQYGVKYTPALVVQSGDGHMVTFYGRTEDIVLDVLLSTITAVSDAKVWFPDNVIRALQHLIHDVSIRVFVDRDCLRCRPVTETAIGLALTSSLISTDVIIARDFPDLTAKYGISTLPKTIFGENLQMDGHVTESQFLEMVFQAEGLKPGPDRRCVMCGNPSPDVICDQCKNRVEAEAKNHKLRNERLKRSETP